MDLENTIEQNPLLSVDTTDSDWIMPTYTSPVPTTLVDVSP